MAAEQVVEEQAPLESEGVHDRQVLWQIVLPIGGGLVFLLSLVGAVTGLTLMNSSAQLQTLSTLMVILFLLLPNFICLMGLYLLVAYLALGMGTFNRVSARQLRRLHRLSETITEGTVSVTENINQRAANARVGIAGVEAAMENAFTPGPATESKEDESE
ncbi:MAG: hypothetical protein AAF125_21390, partial [Chloroflexota bacterium]